ncbi:peptidylprolyl isomerase [Butyrivibrio proteoclasticus]|uniref:peptidylprolyl isomerase n=1 Tax=Butyrivibrio proteoclasticus TaxID=43305 RepID=UPI000A4CDF19|nr:peptidylprolyl isomerase [Butyrivibrio proteoclasticus]
MNLYKRTNNKIDKRACSLMRVFSILLVIICLSSCGFDSENKPKVVFTTGFSDSEVFRIEDSVCSIQEMMVYLVNTQNGYEDTFGTDIWSKETDNGTVEDKLKESVLAKVAQIKAMNLLAKEMEIELAPEEIEKAENAATAYYDTLSEADITAMKQVTKDQIAQIYTEYALADKLYDYIIKDINPEISDDEARTITVEQILIKNYSLDANGEKVLYSDIERAEARHKANNVIALLEEGSSFEELMAEYNEADEGTISFGKGDMEEIYETTAFNLGNEEISNIVETSEGYCIIKCISTFNREETEANKEKIVTQRKRQVFGEKYDAYVATLTKELNVDLWNSITVTPDEAVTTSNLWDVYEEFF